MAKDDSPKKKARKNKEPGRIKQMWQVYRTTRTHDPKLDLVLGSALLLPILAGVALAVFLPGGILAKILWVLTGVLVGILLAMIFLGRRAEKAAYQQIQGQPGAVGAVIKNALRRTWRGSETPIAVSPKTQDAVYRVVGRGGVVLITEGPASRTQKMRLKEEQKVRRILPQVQISHIQVGPDADSVPLWQLSRRLLKIKPVLNRNEVQVVHNRLTSLQASPVAIPKGIDPMRMRAQRPR